MSLYPADEFTVVSRTIPAASTERAMHHGRIWMVAAEHDGSSSLAEHIEAQLACDLARVSANHLKRRDLPIGTPDLILFDLQSPESWDAASQWATQNRCTELISVPWIGLTG